MSGLEIIGAALTFLLFIGLSLAVTVPLTGTLVRLRANFNPKGLQLDPEDGPQPHTGPVITGFFAMMRRVKRLEGWAGLYKGLSTWSSTILEVVSPDSYSVPTLLSNTFLVLFTLVVFGPLVAHPKNRGAYNAPATGAWGTLLYSVVLMLISLPAVIITYRYVHCAYIMLSQY